MTTVYSALMDHVYIYPDTKVRENLGRMNENSVKNWMIMKSTMKCCMVNCTRSSR